MLQSHFFVKEDDNLSPKTFGFIGAGSLIK